MVDYAENVTRRESPGWKGPYQAQIEQKRAQMQDDAAIRRIGSECRMCALVAHFGDRGGVEAPCGICDFCAPSDVRGAAVP